jgi:hypothetical protein
MALVVEDGTGKSDAESYLSVADADAYHTAHGNTGWTGDDAVKEVALRLATRWLNATYQARWIGDRFSSGQALSWPREDAEVDGYVLDAADLPQQLLDATAELALKQVEGDTLFADMSDEGTLKSTTVRVGPITDSKTYQGGSRGIKRYRLAEALVSVLLKPGSQLQRF